ncbi:TROVE domain-containing protein [Actinomycetospora chibensis]|uniref:TROVE domain-containing protein n=1 Tax=Actinomycetospora chibensis TaxID=663606 RepID=A0ABV9RS28_9PSEU|nr:TROVE domain-containing protein [Actinomycetospora chibensis]MDD7923723.1 TROVE domain-containing protein [Actinomycetospora chibensis]
MDPLTSVSTRATSQLLRADERQIPNAAGGFGFALDDDTRVLRFLTLGTDGGTYYATARELTAQNASVVLRAARDRTAWLVEQVVAISAAGRAPRQNPAIFALAAAAALGDEAGRRGALDALPAVCRTGTHLFLFARYVEQFRGWGRGLRRAVARWYAEPDVDDVAFQAVKYRQREGWSHRDLLRLAHPAVTDPDRRALFRWIVGDEAGEDAPEIVRGYLAARAATTASAWARLVIDHRLSWEMLPDAALVEPDVWRALLANGLPPTALMRQLPRLTRLGVLAGDTRRSVAAQLADPARLRRGRVHPVSVLVALRTYASGSGAGGTWEPIREIVDALDAAFYAAFETVVPSGRRTLLAVDVSGSMKVGSVSGLPLSPREASAALALVTMSTERDVTCVGFTSADGGWAPALTELAISPRQRLDDAIAAVSRLPFGSTDCALPMEWARETGRAFDTFVVLTDNETWAGAIHPHQALVRYRERWGTDARLVVVGMTATDVSIADPADGGMLDVAGFDAAAPGLIADFSRGDLG